MRCKKCEFWSEEDGCIYPLHISQSDLIFGRDGEVIGCMKGIRITEVLI